MNDKYFSKKLLEIASNCFVDRAADSVVKTMLRLRAVLKLEHCAYLKVEESNDRLELLGYINQGYNDMWVKRYIEQDFINSDPIVAYGVRNLGIFSWNDVITKSVRYDHDEVVYCAREFGIRNGMSGVVKKYNENKSLYTMLVMSNVDESVKTACSYAISSILPIFTEIIFFRDSDCTHQNLTYKETEVLRWASQGKTIWEISTILGIMESTTKFHMKNIYAKLGVNNRAHAIALANKYYLI